MQCSTIYPFQTRFDLEKDQSQLAGNQKPNKLFYCLIIHIIQKPVSVAIGLLPVMLRPGLHNKFVLQRNERFLELKAPGAVSSQKFCLGLSTLTPPSSLALQLKWGHPAGACTASSFPRDPPHPSSHINEQLTNRVNRNKLATNLFW